MFAFFLCFSDSLHADQLEFELKSNMLQSAKILKTKHGYEAVFRLAEPYSIEFATLTRENIGRRLTMRYKGQAIASAIIQGEIIGGSFTGGVFPARQEAEDFIREMLPGIGEIPVHGPFVPNPLKFDLQPGMLQSLSIEQRSFGHAVLFQILYRLSDAYHPLFADLTRENVGRQLIVRNCNGRVIDGVFTGGVFSTQREAEAFVHEVAPGIEMMGEH